MPLLQGEVSLLTLFADVHYYFSPPNSRPPHDRFDKRSYVYLYHDALNRRGRIEIANHAGTPDQDAFMGYLDTADVEYSYKHTTLFTITVQGRILSGAGGTPLPQPDASQWHLPGADIRNEGRYMYQLHTLEIYLWTTEDAGLFLDSLKRVLAPGQLRTLDASAIHPEHRDSMSPVVQQLEKAAITTPATYQQRSNSISTNHTSHSAPPASTSASASASASASTPTSATAASALASASASVTTAPLSSQLPVSPPSSTPVDRAATSAASFAPIAYNPAAPAAPEPIAHREKTPPPPDAENGTGLGAVAMHESVPQFAGHSTNQQFIPQHASIPYMPGGVVALQPPLGPQVVQHALPISQPGVPTFAAPPVDPNAHLYAVQQAAAPEPGIARQSTMPANFAGYAQPQTQYAQYPPAYIAQAQVGAVPQPGTPTYAVAGASALPSPGLHQPQQQVVSQPQQQIYSAAYAPGNSQGIHQQFYRASEDAPPAKAGPGVVPGKMEKRVDKLEKGVNRWLKRLDR